MCDFDGGYGETADSQISPAGSPPPERPSLLVDAFQSVPDSPLQEPKDSHLAFLIDMYGGSVPQAVISSAFEISHSNFARAEEVIRRFMETDARNNNGLRTPSLPNLSSFGGFETKPTGLKRDWSAEYISLLTALRNTELREKAKHALYKQLDNLATEFATTAKLYGKTIISELNLPPDQRTIQELKGYGCAGGYKYCVGRIFFKFPMDGNHHRSTEDGNIRYMFSGTQEPDNSLSMKTANAELRGNIALHRVFNRLNLRSEILVVLPLMVLLSYRGYRLIASSYFDISQVCFLLFLFFSSSSFFQFIHHSLRYSPLPPSTSICQGNIGPWMF